MQFGISTTMYQPKQIEKLLLNLVDNDINILEVMPWEGHSEMTEPTAIYSFKKKIVDYGLTVLAVDMPANGVDISHIEEYDRMWSIREIEKTIMISLKLSASIVVLHPGGYIRNEHEREERINQCCASLQEIMEFCKPYDIKIVIKNTLPGNIGCQLEEVKKIIMSVNSSKLGFCFDCGYYLINQSLKPVRSLSSHLKKLNMEKYLWHIHAHDNNGQYDSHLLPGEGLFEWKHFLDYLYKNHFQGGFIIEAQKKNQIGPFLARVKQIIYDFNQYSMS